MKVVIVEDSGLMARILTLLIERHGWQVIGHASSAEEARPLVRDRRPDVVTLDLNLAEGGSLALIEDVAAMGIATVVVSGATYPGSPATAEAFRHGAVGCIDKADVGRSDALFDALQTACARDGRAIAGGARNAPA